jgi:DNA polymerase-3 subunit delta'
MFEGSSMSALPDFYGNPAVAQTLRKMIDGGRIPQTILLSGPEGVGKATLARRFAAALLGGGSKIEQDDLSLPQNMDSMAERDKWTAEKRADDPLLFSTHPDFITFSPDGPLRQITIHQIREFRERAQFKPLEGSHRVFLIDRLDRANEQAANSLLKVLEEPPEHMVIFATAENLYDLLPTIRSRSLVLQLSRLAENEMLEFAKARNLTEAATRIALAEGCPGIAATLDLDVFRDRRALMLSALEYGAGLAQFADWVQNSESFGNRKTEKLEFYLKPGYGLLEEILAVMQGRDASRQRDIQQRVTAIAQRVNFEWLEQAVKGVDELAVMVKRNIQKVGALDAMIIKLRNYLEAAGTYS